MATKKLVKLSHSDPKINQLQRNLEDVLQSHALALQSGSLLSSTTGTLDQRYTNTRTTDQRYIGTGSYGSFTASMASFTSSADARYVLTSSFNAYSSSVNRFTASADTRYVLTSSFNPFGASILVFTASVNTFSASINAFTGSVVRTSATYQAITGALAITGSLTYTSNVTPTILSIQNTVPVASTPTCTLELFNNAGWYQLVANQLGNFGIFNKSTFKWGIYVSGNGNVGVNTVTPAEQLEVAGVVRSDTGYRCLNGSAGSSFGNIFNIYWGGTSAQLWIDSTNIGNISTTSDRRLKQFITPMSAASYPTSSLSLVSRLNPVQFRWLTKDAYVDDGIQHAGFIADELQQVIPSAVMGQPNAMMPNGSASYQTLVPSEITPYLVRAIQELSASNAAKDQQILNLQNAVTALSALIKPPKS